MTWFDSYDRAARLAPGLLALLPVTVVLIALGLDETPVLSTLGGVLMVAGGPLVLVSLVRARGRLLQNQLFDRWGGPPTTQLLRLRAPSANPIERDRWREALESRSGIPLPSADEEENNPVEADQAYGAVVAWAIEATRGHALLLEENKSYGFLRNALAMRPVGIALAGLGMVVLLMVALVDGWTPGRGIGFVVVALSFGGWLVWPTHDRVKDAGFRYAAQLLRAASHASTASPDREQEP